MSDDWFSKGLAVIKQRVVEQTGLSMEDVESVYSSLVNIGLIDYDIEKDIAWNELHPED